MTPPRLGNIEREALGIRKEYVEKFEGLAEIFFLERFVVAVVPVH
jgi:hypothetical protein